ncbi:galactofuranose ABC transporter, permease protein YjfF [Micromonospora sp. NBC_01796]|uniref:galactofuranose ABC transporter, permease protein YjfF n=1 Tax=Micromonospora sp. NBC_01796 TaxID=2975987 RepID=UPI002DDC5B5F|nr:galactofuranose ABC transporter, permease protein YjfF [Micromonospora sp. NBC_01796]WSA85985.1 sugar ABC transporter permease YjfF [Micromonospora sp. NBC_01796]
MTSGSITARPSWIRLPRKQVPVLATLALLLVMYGIGVSQYRAFSNVQVIFNIFIDNGFLLVVAVGMTFVILTGGIDLSVGSVVAMTAMVSAWLLQEGLPAGLVLVIALLIGPTLGLLMGCAIHFFEIQPFIVTLAGMFFARGMCTFISGSSIPITDGFWTRMSQERIGDPRGNFVSISVLITLVVVAIAAYTLAYTRLGRNVYAIGGNPQSALLMGLPVGRTRIAVYTISGLCSAIGGILLSFYTLSGAPLIAVGMELDVIAAVVIGGTVLTGGSGYVFGTVLGVLVLGVIQTLITFDGSLSSWWTKIVIGGLLFVFILFQRLIGIRYK